MKKEAVAVLDFGSQYAHLIANRLRRMGIFTEIFIPETPIQKLSEYKGIILSGGPQSVYAKNAPTINAALFSLGIPILGLCYGHQLIAHLLGGSVNPGITKEYGLARLTVKKRKEIFENVPASTQVWMSHGDSVAKLPSGFEHYGSTNDCRFAAMGDPKRKIFSVQFHVEVKHTHDGEKMLANFVDLCGIKKTWRMGRFLKKKIEEIKRTLDGRKVFLLVSGGVDSTVAYALLTRALGTSKVYGLFVDTGLLRKGEAEKTRALFKKIGIKNFHVYDAKNQFLNALKGKTDPEEKRTVIGNMFLKVQADAVRKLKLDPKHWVLGQGTIYPDTIESAGTKYADKIKTHHNRVPEILEMIKNGRIIEPLADLYKDEVRVLGGKLGLPDEMVWKHPFPGPGFGVRILCAHEQIVLAFPEQLIPEKYSISGGITYPMPKLFTSGLKWNVLPIRSVGVGGDSRSYKNPLVVWGKNFSFKTLEMISTNAANHLVAINRVCLLLYPDQIISIKFIPATLTRRRIKLLQELDDIVMKFILKHKIYRKVWQFPTVLIPLSINGVKREAVVLRPICSDEAMTAHFYKMNRALLKKLTLLLAPKVSAVFYDITNKPPGTIEWE